jgi:Flp pilus assembly protein TadB
MTGVQIAMAAGSLIGLGAAGLLRHLAPAHPDLTAALERLAPERSLARPEAIPAASSTPDRVGLWVMRTPLASLVRVPVKELAILRIPVHRFYGQKALYFVLGGCFPATPVALAALMGVTISVGVPLIASVALAVALSFLPDYNVRSDGATARAEFARALSAYVDLVALERTAGSGPRQALEVAAGMGDSWVFRRLAEELARSRWSGVPPWDALDALADDLGLPELAEVSDIMRLSGEEGAAVSATLRARSASMRASQTSAALARANTAGERMSMPVAVLAMIFLALLAVPALLRVLFPGA